MTTLPVFLCASAPPRFNLTALSRSLSPPRATPILSLLAILAATATAAEPPRSALPDAFRADQLLWELELGDHQYTVPVADAQRLYIGINDAELQHPAVKTTGGGILLCLDRATGKTIWQQPIPRYMEGTQAPYHFNHWRCGVCSTPAIDGDRLYIVGPRGDVLCMDANGQADGNDGPFLQEVRYMGVADQAKYQPSKTDGDIIWRFDMIRQIGVVPHDVCGSSPVIHGDYLYACTSNGVDDTHRKVANPAAPSLIVLDKKTGRLAATDGGLIGDRTLHGQWSSPRIAPIQGKSLVLFGGGDGVLYALQPLASADRSDQVQHLKTLWRYDCCPADYRWRDGRPIPYARWNRKSSDGPSEIISTPLIDPRGRIYVAIGQSPLHGPGQGILTCIDGSTGQKIWETRQVDRTLSDATVHDGLLYISDYSGRLHCLDAETGTHVWQHDLGAGVWCASPVVADGKVYISTEKKLFWVLKASRQKQVLTRSRLRNVAITPAVSGDVMYLPTQKRLFAVQLR